MLSLFSFLNSICPLSGDATAALMKVVRAKELRRGQVWLQEGAVCDKLTFVVKGLLKLYFETGSKEVVLSFAKEDEWMISVKSYIMHSASSYSIRAIEPSVIIYLSQAELTFLLERFPELQFHFLVIAHAQMVLLEQHTGLLLLPPNERFEKLSEEGSWIVNGGRITDRLFAAYLGVGANTVCKWRKG